jgi:hypothetical protein
MPRTSIITPEKFTTFGELLRVSAPQSGPDPTRTFIAVGYSESQISPLGSRTSGPHPEEATLAATTCPRALSDE